MFTGHPYPFDIIISSYRLYVATVLFSNFLTSLAFLILSKAVNLGDVIILLYRTICESVIYGVSYFIADYANF